MKDWMKQMEQLQSMAEEIRKKGYDQGQFSSWADLDSLFQHDLWNKINNLSEWTRSSNLEKIISPGNQSGTVKNSNSVPPSQTWPKINAYITPQEVIVRCALPGLKRSSLQMSLVGEQNLEIEGYIRENHFSDEVEKTVLEEQFQGKFSRTIELPVAVVKRGAYHKWSDGILDIHLIRKPHSFRQEKVRI
jgi:HSP20 family molecular chaperone IbpA